MPCVQRRCDQIQQEIDQYSGMSQEDLQQLNRQRTERELQVLITDAKRLLVVHAVPCTLSSSSLCPAHAFIDRADDGCPGGSQADML